MSKKNAKAAEEKSAEEIYAEFMASRRVALQESGDIGADGESVLPVRARRAAAVDPEAIEEGSAGGKEADPFEAWFAELSKTFDEAGGAWAGYAKGLREVSETDLREAFAAGLSPTECARQEMGAAA